MLLGTLCCTILSTFFVLGSFANAQEASDVSVKFDQAQTPILILSNGGATATKLQEIDLPSTSEAPTEIVVTLSDPKFVLGLQARIGDAVVGSYDFNGIFNVDLNTPTMPTQVPVQIDEQAAKIALEKSKTLSIWTSPSEFAAPDLKIKIGVQSVSFANKKCSLDNNPIEYRFGVVVRNPGWDGVAAYRIPALARTNKGALIAVYDARNRGAQDLPADIDVACSRSFDNGKTWEPMKKIVDLKGDDETKEGVGDPCVLVDPSNGRIWVAALWAHNGKSLAQSAPGLNLGESGQLILVYSDDEGGTWSSPRNITKEIATYKDWRVVFQGPGSGICTRNGTLVFPAQIFNKDRGFHSTVIWSSDQGKTWTIGTEVPCSTCESQVVELNDGELMLNMRNYNTKLVARSVMTTNDFGQTWKEHVTSGKSLPCPVCQGSFIRVQSKLDGDDSNILAFMNPNSEKGRVDMTLKLSEDEGQTWPRSLTLYRPGGYGYSSITKIDSETIGVLYETAGGLIYQTVKIQDVQ